MKQVHLIMGDEYRCDAKARELIDGLLPPESRAFGLEQIDGSAQDIGQIVSVLGTALASLRTRGFLGGAKVTWLKGAAFLDSAEQMKNDQVRNACVRLVEELGKGLPPSHVAVITAPGMDGRSALYKALAAVAEVTVYSGSEKPTASQKEAEADVRSALSAAGLRATAGALQSLAARTGNDMRCIVNEVEKLSLYAGQAKELKVEDIEILVPMSRELPAWDLADAFGRRELGRALALLRQMLYQRASPLQLALGVLGRIRELILLRAALEGGWLRVTGDAERGNAVWGAVPESVETAFSDGLLRDPRKSHPYRQWILCRQALNYSGAELENCRRVATDAYRKLLSSPASLNGLALELMFLKMMPGRKAV